MFKSILVAALAVIGLTLAVQAAPQPTYLKASLESERGMVGAAYYTEKWIDEERVLQILELKMTAEPGEELLVSIDGRAFAKVQADRSGSVYFGVKAVRKAHADGDKIPAAKKNSTIKVGSAVGQFADR